MGLELDLELSIPVFDLEFESTSFDMDILQEIRVIEIQGEPYDGPYYVTPSRESQTLPTNNRYASADIIVGPIPQNYGLITYDGSKITVS